jgi:pyruvate/2-oxoglutarate dehydrogenase complex dihydrolipoamide acyltransferase (E2) component
MVKKIKVPKLTENDEEQVVTAWFKKVGDAVSKGEPLLEMSTSKAAVEIESPCSGVLRATLAEVKSSLPVGYVVALIGGADEALPDVSEGNRKLMAAQAQAVRTAPAKVAPVPAEAGALRATPAARRVAREKGVDLALVQARYKVEVVTESVLNRYLEESRA